VFEIAKYKTWRTLNRQLIGVLGYLLHNDQTTLVFKHYLIDNVGRAKASMNSAHVWILKPETKWSFDGRNE